MTVLHRNPKGGFEAVVCVHLFCIAFLFLCGPTLVTTCRLVHTNLIIFIIKFEGEGLSLEARYELRLGSG